MFKVGDKVRVIDYTNEVCSGLRGVITSLSNNHHPIIVDLEHFGYQMFDQEQLTLDNENHVEELKNTQRYKTTSGKQLFDVLEDDLLTYEELRGFYKANIYKYTHRYKQKNGIEDLKKVKVYTDQLIKLEEKQNAI